MGNIQKNDGEIVITIKKSIDFVSCIIDYKIATLERVSFTCGAKWMQFELIEKNKY